MATFPPIIVELKAMSSEFKASMVESKASMAELESEGSKHMSGLQGAAKTAAVGIGVAFVAGAGMSIKAGIDYQSTMAKVQGSAQLTTAQVKAIGDSFTGTMGKSTFSAQQMATSFAPVAGVVKQISGGTLTAASSMQFMKAAMDASEATGTSLASTTHDLSQVMLTYAISTKDAGEASNTLFNISRATGVGLDTLTATVDKLHTKLGAASPSLADTGTLMVDLAAHGVTGSRGVMTVTGAMTTLLGGSKATSAELTTLGVHVYDSSGKFVGMGSVLQQLQPKLAGMTDQQKHAAEAALFGKTAAATLNSTLLAGVGAWDTASAAVTKKDAVDKAAAAQSATLHGQIEKVAATAEDLAVKFGQFLIPILQKAIGVISSIVSWFSKHTTIAKILGIAIGVLAAGIGVAAVATRAYNTVVEINKVLQGEAAAKTGLQTIALGIQKAALAASTAAQWLFNAAFDANPITLVVVAIAAFAVGIVEAYKHCGPFRDIVNAIGSALKVVWDNVLKPVVNFFMQHWKVALGIAVAVFAPFIALPVLVVAKWRTIVSFFTAIWHDIVSGVEAGWNAVKNAVMAAVDFVINFIKDHWKLIIAILTGPIGVAVGLIATYWDQIKAAVGAAMNAIGAVISTVMGAVEATWNAVWGAISTLTSAVFDGIKTVISTAIDAIHTTITSVTDAISTAWNATWGAIKTVFTTIWSYIKTFVTDEINGVKAVISSAIDAIKSVWTTTWNAVKTTVTTIWDGIKSGVTTAINTVEKTISTVTGTISKAWDVVWGAMKKTVVDMVNDLGVIVNGIWSGIKKGFHDVINGGIDIINLAIKGINGLISAANEIPFVNIPKIHELPHVATGGMTTGLMAAVIGDNPSGQEVVLPMDSPKTIQTLSVALSQAAQIAQPGPGPLSVHGSASGAPAGAGAGVSVAPVYNINVNGADVSNPHAITAAIKTALNANNANLVRNITAAGGRR